MIEPTETESKETLDAFVAAMAAIYKVACIRQTVSQTIHRYFHENGFYWLPTPIITTSDCEGAGELFRVSSLDLANPPLTENGEDAKFTPCI